MKGGDQAAQSASENTLSDLLRTGAKEIGINLSGTQIEQCLAYIAELGKWNRKINLTAIHEAHEVVIKHFLDSFLYLKAFSPANAMKLLDLGSGAGFPALPLKIVVPELVVALVESTGKKASFLRHIIRILGLEGIEVIEGRTEFLPDKHYNSYDVVTARAFADIPYALKEGARFLMPGGLLVLSRGQQESVPDERIISLGFSKEARILLNLPFSHDPRALWVFKKRHDVPRGT